MQARATRVQASKPIVNRGVAGRAATDGGLGIGSGGETSVLLMMKAVPCPASKRPNPTKRVVFPRKPPQPADAFPTGKPVRTTRRGRVGSRGEPGRRPPSPRRRPADTTRETPGQDRPHVHRRGVDACIMAPLTAQCKSELNELTPRRDLGPDNVSWRQHAPIASDCDHRRFGSTIYDGSRAIRFRNPSRVRLERPPWSPPRKPHHAAPDSQHEPAPFTGNGPERSTLRGSTP